MNDKKWLRYVIELSKKCPVSESAFAVGAAIVDGRGNVLADGFSRETDPQIHAEESALQKLPTNIDLSNCTFYSSLEPCNTRLSQPKGCAELIIESGIKRVVFAATEPPIFVEGNGAEKLKEAGIEIEILSEFIPEVINTQSPIIQKQWQLAKL